jgi:hypothetical protein
LLLTKYGKVTQKILDDLTELLEVLRKQWVYMQLPLTPKFHCLVRHAVSQLKSTGGGICDIGEDGIERSHQERLKDQRRYAGLKDFRRRTDSQTKMQHIRLMKEVKAIRDKINLASMRNMKRDVPLSELSKDKHLVERTGTRARGCEEASVNVATITEQQPNGRQLNLIDAAQGKLKKRRTSQMEDS